MTDIVSKSRWVCLLLVVLGALVLNGCASTEPDNMSERPWNAPQNWENGLPSGMMGQYR